jgi:hypothetical protein
MAYNPKFGSAAQTPEQRAWVLARMQQVIPSLETKVTACIQHEYDRYIAGELSWTEMRQGLKAANA